MNSLRILHITNWYPNAKEEHEALFIRRHIQALSKHCENTVVHIQFDPCDHWERVGPDSGGEQWTYYWKAPFKKWRIIEWMTSLLLRHLLRSKFKPEDYDAVNVHIAYPLCTWIKGLKKRMDRAGVPLLITEHWTAYHFNFNLPNDTKKLDRIKRIFHFDVPLVTVSKALKKDIEEFSGMEQKNAHVVPNVVDTELFCPPEKKGRKKDGPVFFMLNYWRRIKSPIVLFEAFEALLKEHPKAELRVGGYGPLWAEMEQYVKKRGLEPHIRMLGKLDKDEVAEEMKRAYGFVHAASYETFSVVCAEALCCGTPVAVSRIPAVEEFIDEKNGILVDEAVGWEKSIDRLLTATFDRTKIAEAARSKFSCQAVGEHYFKTVEKLKSGL